MRAVQDTCAEVNKTFANRQFFRGFIAGCAKTPSPSSIRAGSRDARVRHQSGDGTGAGGGAAAGSAVITVIGVPVVSGRIGASVSTSVVPGTSSS